jgi:hypothetical protein
MTQDEIIEMARQAGFTRGGRAPAYYATRAPAYYALPDEIEAFAKLVEDATQQRTWVGLTKDEIETLSYKAEGNTWKAVELAEAKLKEKNI